MSKLLIISALIFNMSFAYAGEINTNVGLKSLDVAPTIFGDVEYTFYNQSIRALYSSNFSSELYGHSRYNARYLHYTFYSGYFNQRKWGVFLLVGNGEKIKNGVEEERYGFKGIGVENIIVEDIFRIEKIDSRLFFRAGVQENDVEDFRFNSDDRYTFIFGSIGVGLSF